MPASVSALTGRKVRGVLELSAGAKIHIQYYPDRISAKTLRTLLQAGQLMEQPSTVQNTLAIMDVCAESADFIVRIVAEWDLLLTPDAMEPCPLNADVVGREFGLPLLFDILTSLVGLVNLGEVKGTSSSTRSRPSRSSRSSNSSPQ